MINRRRQGNEIRSTIFEMGQGGQAKRVSIVATTTRCVHLYKEYRDDLTVDRVQLEAIAAWPAGLVEDDQVWLESHAAWISHVVENDQGHVVGVLLPIARESFWYEKGSRPSPREGGKLLQRKSPRPGDEIFPRPHLYVFLARLLENIMWFHNRGVVLGDLQLPNLLVGESEGSISPFLIDMDAVWIGNQSAVGMVQNTLYAAPGFSGDHLTRETDLYKFALIACKVLAQDNGVITTRECAGSLSPSQKETIDQILRCDASDPVSDDALRRLVDQWSGCVSGGFVYSSESDDPVPYAGDVDLVLHRTEAPAVDFCSKDAAPTVNDNRTDIAPNMLGGTREEIVVKRAPDPAPRMEPVVPVVPPTQPQRGSGGHIALALLGLVVILAGGLVAWYLLGRDDGGSEGPAQEVASAPRVPQTRIGASTGYVDAFAWSDEQYLDIGGDEEPTVSGFGDIATDDSLKTAVCGNEDTSYRPSSNSSMIVTLPVVPDQYTYVTFCLEDKTEVADWTVTIVGADETNPVCSAPKSWTQMGTPRDGAVAAGVQIDRRCVLGDELSLEITSTKASIRVWGVSLWQGEYQYVEAPATPAQSVPPGTVAPPQ